MVENRSKILIVDDSSSSRYALRHFLEDQYLIEEAADGTSALSLIENFRPDLVLLDIIMPDINGIEIAQWITRHRGGQNIMIIMISTKTDASDVEEGLQAGAHDYVKKPFNEIELKARVSSALRLRQHINDLNRTNHEKELLIEHLKGALKTVETMTGLLPICSSCKKIRDDEGYWQQVEQFISLHTSAQLTHSICPDCARELYPEETAEKEKS